MEKKGLMTSGSIYKCIFLFTIPLILGNFFQLMYNTIDSIIVGNYVGSTALAAVGTSTPIINLLIAFFQGLSTGAGVVVARYYGARKTEEESTAIHSFILFALIFGIALSIIGVVFAPTILKWMGTPADCYDQAVAYLRIYFAGSIFVTIYNAGTGILQAVGDSKHPLYYLIATSVLNVFGDLFFVKTLGMGTAGAALATVVCEGISVVLVLGTLMRSKSEYRLSLNKLKINGPILKEIVRIGVPSGIQGMVVSVSNVVVMSYVNAFGSASTAGFSSANKFDNFIGLPVNCFMLAITTFTGQNLGARKYDRVVKGVHASLVMSIATVVTCGIIVYIFADPLIGLFSTDAEVIAAGAKLIRIMCPYYTFLCFHQVWSGALRASGRSMVPMITSIMAFVVIRQIFLAIAMPIYNDLGLIGYGYSFTWILAAVFTGIYYFRSHWLKKEEEQYGMPAGTK
ncbi:MAG: MATE family efflux transporter [Solobacterium sp.]|jgi:putative MATE family efflux protein|nr:MATE family efflux transporter [Solobacterium sp.]MCH4223020.1 MATE family efflux transporter [Solobacterium sp.]MCH4266357.1 MATE family efflux transporter [Solobacterium sp.]